MNRLRQLALNAIKYPLRHPSNQGYPVTSLIYTKQAAAIQETQKLDVSSELHEPLWKTKCQELVNMQHKGLQKAQMKEHLDHLIYDGKRSSDLLKLYAAQSRRAAIDSGLKNDQLPSMSKDIYNFITQKRKVSENRLHQVQELGVKAADLDVIYDELPQWNFSVTAINPSDGRQFNSHPLAKSHIQKNFEFSNAQQCNMFVQRIGQFLYKMDHHPQWELHQEGGRLTVKMTSHFLFNNVTNSDVRVARQLDSLYLATKISSLEFLKMRIIETLPFGSLLLGLFGASLLGILMIKNYFAYNTTSLNWFELNTVPQTISQHRQIDNLDVQTKYLLNDIYSPHYAQIFDKKKDLIIDRPDYTNNQLVGRVFQWDRGSQGFEANKRTINNSNYIKKESERTGGSHSDNSQ